MKLIKDSIVGRYIGIGKIQRYEIKIKRLYFTGFDKNFEEIVCWDSFASYQVWKREEEIQVQQMINCGYKIERTK